MRFHLRTLLIVLTVGLLLLVFVFIRYRERAAAIEVLKKARADEERRQELQRTIMFPTPIQSPESSR
jgi:hypothetical protein